MYTSKCINLAPIKRRKVSVNDNISLKKKNKNKHYTTYIFSIES